MNAVHAVAASTIVLVGSCAGSIHRTSQTPKTASGSFVVVKGAEFLGAIIPADADHVAIPVSTDGFWTPTPSHVRMVEAGLGQALIEFESHEYIRENLVNYRRQYVGLIDSDQRVILVNAFPGPKSDRIFSHGDWLRNYVVVFDGGYHYWQIRFNPETGQYSQFKQNAYG